MFNTSILSILALLTVCFRVTHCGNALNPDFLGWMKRNIKVDEVDRMIRDDVTTGSFGGGSYSGSVRPVVMVHGLSNEAGSLWSIRAALVAGGFPINRTFATTWGDGEIEYDLNVNMSCTNVIQIRRFIEIVLAYTKSPQIDVIGYSLGSPLARKAILGGKCVDDDLTNLGDPLTSKIHTYISVAGANQGSQICGLPFFDICNNLTGLSCDSAFLHDINKQGNYESTFRSYNLASTFDEDVGYEVCGRKASSFTGAEEHTIHEKTHTQTEFETGDIQLKMLRAS